MGALGSEFTNPRSPCSQLFPLCCHLPLLLPFCSSPHLLLLPFCSPPHLLQSLPGDVVTYKAEDIIKGRAGSLQVGHPSTRYNLHTL